MKEIASFVIHHIAMEKFISKLEEKYKIILPNDDKKELILGNLIPDSCHNSNNIKEQTIENRQEEKRKAHFRDEDDLNKCIQTPNILKFILKYQSLLENHLSVLGYLFHLYTDKMFFDDLFNETFKYLDNNYEETIYRKEVAFMKVNKNNVLYNACEFWDINNPTSIYHDYTIMNKILLNYYDMSFDKKELIEFSKLFINPGIDEVNYKDIISIIEKTAIFINESYKNKEQNLNIFEEDKIKDFITDVVNTFIRDYSKFIFSNKNILSVKKVKK